MVIPLCFSGQDDGKKKPFDRLERGKKAGIKIVIGGKQI